MWYLATVGPHPFFMQEDGLALRFRPELPAWIFRKDGTLQFTFLGRVLVVYHNTGRRDLFSTERRRVRRMVLTDIGGETERVEKAVITEPWSSRIRERHVTRVDVYFE